MAPKEKAVVFKVILVKMARTVWREIQAQTGTKEIKVDMRIINY